MLYEFECKWDGTTIEISRPAWKSSFDARCPRCSAIMERIYAPPQISFGTFKPGYYHAFGSAFSTEHQLENAKRKYKGETGKEVIEIGNELNALKKLRPPRKRPDIAGAMREMKTKKVNFNA